MGVISGLIWGSFRGRDHFGDCTDLDLGVVLDKHGHNMRSLRSDYRLLVICCGNKVTKVYESFEKILSLVELLCLL